MKLTHKIKLYPTPRQARWFAQQAGFERLLYNKGVATWRGMRLWKVERGWKTLRNAIRAERNRLTWDYSHLGVELATQGAGQRLRFALAAMKNSNQKNGAPVFAKRHDRRSFAADDGHWERNQVEGRRVRIPKLGRVKMREPLRFDGRVVKLRVVEDAKGWYVCIGVDTGADAPKTRKRRTVGVDVGVKTLAYTSDGDAYANPAPLKAALIKLRAVNKAIERSRKVHGRKQSSIRRNRLYAKRKRLYARVANIHRNAHRQVASAIAKSAGKVVVETLNVLGMVKNRRLARAVQDAGLGGLIREIEWQCAKRGVAFEKVDRWFASSKLCSRCGWKNATLKLSHGVFQCRTCGWEVDRDYNAALNIKMGASSAPSVEATPLQLRLGLAWEAQTHSATR